MERQTATKNKTERINSSSLSRGILQRKCACGNQNAGGGECGECGKNKQFLQRRATHISEPGDRYEQEADRIADQVMRMPEPTAKNQVGSEKEGVLQRKASVNSITPVQPSSPGQDRLSEVPPIVDEVLRSPGQPLDTETRTFMEPRFGQNFSQVRVHTDAKAGNSAKKVNAMAYTVGQDVVFDTGHYKPKTSSGKELLAHELTHTLQQSQYSDNKPMTSSLKPVQPLSLMKLPLLLQRKCGNDIGSPIPDCQPNKDEVSGEQFFFEVNCDDLKPDEDEHIKKFVSSLPQGVTLKIHGYASEEGTDAFNMDLSCHRTNKIASLLQMAVPATSSALSITGFLKHGAQKGKPLDYWRTVIVEVIKPKTPEPKKEEPPSSKAPVPPAPCIPKPIDLLKLPDVMDAKGWREGAILLRQWFSQTPTGGVTDSTTITMNWVLSFARAKTEFDTIFKEKLYVNDAAQKQIRELLKKISLGTGGKFNFNFPVTILDPVFDIQFRPVGGMLDPQDGLKAALGRFTFRMVVGGSVWRNPVTSRNEKVLITDVGVHVRDSFDFEGFQPLGCWNICTNDVGIICSSGGEFVYNSSFREWRKLHGKGGDFKVLSDVESKTLDKPEIFDY